MINSSKKSLKHRLTVQNVDSNIGRSGIWWITLVVSWIGWACFLNQQNASASFTSFGRNAHSSSQTGVTDYLKQTFYINLRNSETKVTETECQNFRRTRSPQIIRIKLVISRRSQVLTENGERFKFENSFRQVYQFLLPDRGHSWPVVNQYLG